MTKENQNILSPDAAVLERLRTIIALISEGEANMVADFTDEARDILADWPLTEAEQLLVSLATFDLEDIDGEGFASDYRDLQVKGWVRTEPAPGGHESDFLLFLTDAGKAVLETIPDDLRTRAQQAYYSF
jgi:hypothetical protein